MPSLTPRAGRWPLALSRAALAALAVLGACADEPVSPRNPSTLEPRASVQDAEQVNVVVTNTSGGTEVGSLRWAASQVAAAAGGGSILIDASLAGDTIVLGAELELPTTTYIYAPEDKGITISGNDQHRVMSSTGPYLSLWKVTVTKGYAASGSAISAVSLALDNSNVQDNRGPGSAIFVEDRLYIGNGTVSRNVAGGPAVEYNSGAQVQIDNSTIAYNAPGPGLGVYGYPSYATRVQLHNAIISNNGSPLRNCSSTFNFEYVGTNISNDWNCGEVGIVVADPLLMPLADNGGPVMTHAIPHTSPAYNTGVDCWWDTDARNVPRDAKCDVGAFEFNDFTKITITINPTAKVDAATGRAVLTGTVKCTRYEYFRLALELHQDQKVGKNVVDVHAASDVPIECGPIGGGWRATMVLTPGEAFQAGAARATAQTFNTPEWATPAGVASAVKLSISRK
jgi:hypothetical protein